MTPMQTDKKKLHWLNPKQIKNALIQMKNTGFSMRRRFVIYLLSLFCSFFAFALLLLNLLGVLNPADAQLRRALDHHLENTAVNIQNSTDNLAAYAIAFSGQMEDVIEKALADRGLTFDHLKNDPEALTSLQEAAYQTVYTNLQLAPCSGAFYVLNTTCNDSLDTSFHNGLYLKFSNLYSENTIHNKVCLYRGSASVARSHCINLHSTWHLEMDTSAFSEIDAMLNASENALSQPYSFTALYPLSDSWENVRFMCVPLRSAGGQIIGVCGFEITSLYFQLSQKIVDDTYPYIVGGLFDKRESGYIGQFAGNQSGFMPSAAGVLSAEEGRNYVTFSNESGTFLGKTQEIRLGSQTYTVAMMIPLTQYNEITRAARLKIVVFLVVVTVAALAACLWLSKRYVSPILEGLEQIKSEKRDSAPSHIPEINDLFVFLDGKDREYEETLSVLVQEKQNVQSEKDRLQTEYEKARSEIARLAYSRKQEIDPEDYKLFVDGLSSLTRTERKIFGYYLSGKTAKEIMAIASIKESTLRYHNQNIYGKLGVNSLKQMLRYAALMKEEEEAMPNDAG